MDMSVIEFVVRALGLQLWHVEKQQNPYHGAPDCSLRHRVAPLLTDHDNRRRAAADRRRLRRQGDGSFTWRTAVVRVCNICIAGVGIFSACGVASNKQPEVALVRSWKDLPRQATGLRDEAKRCSARSWWMIDSAVGEWVNARTMTITAAEVAMGSPNHPEL